MKRTLTLLGLFTSILIYAQTDNSNFRPCFGNSTASPLEQFRLLTATSKDGINWTKTNFVLTDNASVADGIVLSDGTILIYYVAGCENTGSEQSANEIKMVKSQNNGKTWSYHNVIINNTPVGGTPPVDPNVVLMPNGDISMLVTIDADQSGPLKPKSYRATSIDNGSTYTIIGDSIYSITDTLILDPENFRVDASTWYIYAGGVQAQNLLGLSTDDGNSFQHQGLNCTAISQNPPNCYVCADITEYNTGNYIMHAFGDDGNGYEEIVKLSSTDCLNWTLDGTALQLNLSSTVESSKVWAPSVIKLSDGSFLMVYETILPVSWNQTLGSISIIPEDTTIYVGDTLWFGAIGEYADQTKRGLTTFSNWNSTMTVAGTIDSRGMFIAQGIGTTDVTANENSVTSNVTTVSVQLPTGINDDLSTFPITIYPNPFSDFTIIEIQGIKNQWTWTLYNSVGQVVQNITDITEPQLIIKKGDLATGVYMYQVQIGNTLVYSGKLTIE